MLSTCQAGNHWGVKVAILIHSVDDSRQIFFPFVLEALNIIHWICDLVFLELFSSGSVTNRANECTPKRS